jgi:hypothetical protein
LSVFHCMSVMSKSTFLTIYHVCYVKFDFLDHTTCQSCQIRFCFTTPHAIHVKCNLHVTVTKIMSPYVSHVKFDIHNRYTCHVIFYLCNTSCQYCHVQLLDHTSCQLTQSTSTFLTKSPTDLREWFFHSQMGLAIWGSKRLQWIFCKIIFLFALKLYFRALMNLSEVPHYYKKLPKMQ